MDTEASGQSVFNQGREVPVALRNNIVFSEVTRGILFFGLIMPLLVVGFFLTLIFF